MTESGSSGFEYRTNGLQRDLVHLLESQIVFYVAKCNLICLCRLRSHGLSVINMHKGIIIL